MKLRNKRTGEIATLTLSSNGEELLLMKNNEMVTRNVKLSDLEEWEDAPEEPKGMQWVDVLGANDGRVVIQYPNEEEAEKAVEKLKAWKRLRDRNLRFDLNYSMDGATINHKDVILCRIEAYFDDKWEEDNMKAKEDLDLLLGGEE